MSAIVYLFESSTNEKCSAALKFVVETTKKPYTMKTTKRLFKKRVVSTYNEQPKRGPAMMLSLHPVCTKVGMY